MGRLNAWLLHRLDSVSEPEQLPPRLEQMRVTVERRMARVVFLTIVAAFVYTIGFRLMSYGPTYLFLAAIPLSFVTCVGFLIGISYHSRMTVREYALWLKLQPPVPSRVTRMGVPYERQAPVATRACEDCPAIPGQRHVRSCPSVPPEWFKR